MEKTRLLDAKTNRTPNYPRLGQAVMRLITKKYGGDFKDSKVLESDWGVSQSMVSGLKNGVKSAEPATLVRVAVSLGAEPYELWIAQQQDRVNKLVAETLEAIENPDSETQSLLDKSRKSALKKIKSAGQGKP